MWELGDAVELETLKICWLLLIVTMWVREEIVLKNMLDIRSIKEKGSSPSPCAQQPLRRRNCWGWPAKSRNNSHKSGATETHFFLEIAFKHFTNDKVMVERENAEIISYLACFLSGVNCHFYAGIQILLCHYQKQRSSKYVTIHSDLIADVFCLIQFPRIFSKIPNNHVMTCGKQNWFTPNLTRTRDNHTITSS